MTSTTGISRNTLTEHLKRHKDAAESAISSMSVDDKGNFSLEQKALADYNENRDKANEIKSILDGMDSLAEIDRYLTEPTSIPSAARGLSGVEYKSLGDVFIESEEYRRFNADGANFDRGTTIAGAVEGKSIFNMSGGTVSHQSLGTAQHLGLTERALRKEHIRDLFDKSTTKAPILWGLRETGWANNAAVLKQRNAGNTGWNDGAPESNITITTDTFPVAEVAHTLDAHKNILSDEPRLRNFINNRLVDGIKYAEDRELLHGTGGSESITGLLNTPGIQEYTGLAADKHSVQVRRAITKALIAEYNPTGLVVSPAMWEALEIETDDTGAFRVAIAVAVGAQKRIWRVDVVETTAMDDAQFLLGAFKLGAQLHDRETASVSVSSEHSDNFKKGIVTFRADERLALEVNRPESFVVGTWTDPTP